MDGLQQLRKRKIPTKLNDCKIVNSYVNLTLGTNYNSDYVIDQLIVGLNSIFRGNEFQKIVVDSLSESPLQSLNKYIYINKSFKIKLENSTISINCNQSYPGWTAIRDLIAHMIEILSHLDNNIRFPVLEIEYLSAFPEIEIFSIIEGTIHLNYIPNFDNTTFEFQCQIHNEQLSRGCAIGAVKLQNNARTHIRKKVSFVTIGVRHDNPDRVADDVIKDIEIIHYGEKELFFNLISDEYIQSQGPEYE